MPSYGKIHLSYRMGKAVTDFLGASQTPEEGTAFLVWAPIMEKVEVKLLPETGSPITHPMERLEDGYFGTVLSDVGQGSRYLFVLDGKVERPDPASCFQPQGVHGPSEVVWHDNFKWTDTGWQNPPLMDYVIYELHVGTFTQEGTFEAIIPHVPYLKDLGVTAVELMPVAQFPGRRNWGYDGVYPFSVHNSYGGPKGLKSLINECHANGIAVILDVVYNHLGPEGNYLWDYGPYFTDRYRTPWGAAINFDGPLSGGPRRFFIENALHWLNRYHIDALRIDAVHGIFDFGAKHFLRELKEAVEAKAERNVYLIPESDLNDVRLITPPQAGGYGLDAQWNDDFHHALHTLLTGEKDGYYMDFGEFGQMTTALREGFVYSWRYSRFRKRMHGSPSGDVPPGRFVVSLQNHDQVGNRMRGDRLSDTLGAEKLKLAAAVVILSPYIPLIFMGEEYREKAPFMYFVDHSDPALIEAVRKGRREEFASFNWNGEVPDPQAESTFEGSRIDLSLRDKEDHAEFLGFYRELIRLRKSLPAVRQAERGNIEVTEIEDRHVIILRYRHREGEVFWAASFNEEAVDIGLPFGGRWSCLLDTARGKTGQWAGGSDRISGTLDMAPFGFSLYRQE